MIEKLLSATAVHVIAELAFASRGIRDGLDVVLTIFARHTHRLRLVGRGLAAFASAVFLHGRP